MAAAAVYRPRRSEEHTSELQSPGDLVCRLLLAKKKTHTGGNDRIKTFLHSMTTVISCVYISDRTLTAPSTVLFALTNGNVVFFFFFLIERATPEIYLFSLPAAFPT